MSTYARDEDFLTVAEVARLLRVSKMTVYRLIEQDELSSVRVGRSLRVVRASLDRYVIQGGNQTDWSAPRYRV